MSVTMTTICNWMSLGYQISMRQYHCNSMDVCASVLCQLVACNHCRDFFVWDVHPSTRSDVRVPVVWMIWPKQCE